MKIIEISIKLKLNIYFQMNLNCSQRDVMIIGNGNTVSIDSMQGYNSFDCDSYRYHMYSTKTFVIGIVCICVIICILWYCCRRRNKQHRDQTKYISNQHLNNNNDNNC